LDLDLEQHEDSARDRTAITASKRTRKTRLSRQALTDLWAVSPSNAGIASGAISSEQREQSNDASCNLVEVGLLGARSYRLRIGKGGFVGEKGTSC